MISVDKALEMALVYVQRLPSTVVPLLEGQGKVLAEEIISDVDIPPFNKSILNGYALRAEDAASNGTILEVVGEIPAGHYPTFRIERGQAARIMSGAPLPEGGNAVQMMEKTRSLANGKRVGMLASVTKGENITFLGELIHKGEVILAKDTYIGPSEIGILATMGRLKIRVYRVPEVAVIATGNELVEVDQKPRLGQIRNSNTYSLLTQIIETGGTPKYLGIAPDNKRALQTKIKKGLSSNLLLISGGASTGEFNLVEEVLSELGVEIIFYTVGRKPGTPTVFGKKGDTIILGLPGNPVSTVVIFEVFVAPIIRKMMGLSRLHNWVVKARLKGAFRKSDLRRTYLPAWTQYENGELVAQPIPSRGSADIISFSKCNSLLIVPEETSSLKSGSQVHVFLRKKFFML